MKSWKDENGGDGAHGDGRSPRGDGDFEPWSGGGGWWGSRFSGIMWVYYLVINRSILVVPCPDISLLFSDCAACFSDCASGF